MKYFYLVIIIIFLFPVSYSSGQCANIEANDQMVLQDPYKILQDEAIVMVFEQKESSYLSTLSFRLSQEIERSSGELRSNLDNKEDLIRHAHILFFTMRAYFNNLQATFRYVIKESGIMAAAEEALDPILKSYQKSKKQAEKIGKRWWVRKVYKNKLEIATNKAWKVYEREALKVHTTAIDSESAALDLAKTWEAVAKNLSLSDFYPIQGSMQEFYHPLMPLSDRLSLYYYDTAHLAANRALKPTAEGATKRGKTPGEIIDLGNQIAENICILVYLENIEDILSKAFARDNREAVLYQDENVFSSTDKWFKLTGKITEELEEKSMQFLKPWLSELDRIVTDIEAASE